MTIISTADMGFRTLSDCVLKSLNPDLQFVLRRLLFVLQTPIDSPRIDSVPINELLEQIDVALTVCYPSSASPLIDTFLNDARAWLTQVLPGPLWAHCLGTNLLTGLARTTLARKSSGFVIQAGDKDQEQETAVALGIALDGYLAAHKKDVGSAVAYKIKSICQRNRKLSNYADKQRMLKGCLALAPEACETGPITSLLLAWVIDLIESGSPRLESVSPATIHKYTGNALISLYQYFRNVEIESLTSENFSDISGANHREGISRCLAVAAPPARK